MQPHAKRPRLSGPDRSKKACINCRNQKMKCVPSEDAHSEKCRRCLRTGVPCVFVPRANAASGLPSTDVVDVQFKQNVLRRLQAVEELLGMAGSAEAGASVETMSSRADEDTTENGIQENEEDNNSDDDSTLPPSYASLGALWQAVAALQASAPSPSNFPLRIWKKRTVGELWLAFHERMPGLHFMPRKQIFSAPQPLLLASILYCSSVRGPTETATELAPHYFSILCHTISQLLVPESSVSSSIGTSAEEWAFQTVLGIVLASLLTEASNRVVGLWISVAYRLILEHCPTDGPDGPSGLPGGTEHADDGAREWRKLFSGVQIIDLEHASLHLSCPVIPMESPLPALRVGYRDQLYRLSRMMHTGLTHFTGRGLPTIWSVFGRDSGRIHVPPQFTATDAAVIRDWARQLDDWLVEFSRRTDVASTAEQQRLVFRQYVLHRLVVLSIYHPARGCNLWSNSITPQEQHELLLSARATLKLHLHDDSIWANWDLVMITWAALIVIQAVEGGVGESDDLQNIQVHLGMLKWVQKTHDPASSPCGRLIQRLEESLQRVHTPQQAMDTEQSSLVQQTPGMDYQSWHIFDQASLEQIGYVQWPLQG